MKKPTKSQKEPPTEMTDEDRVTLLNVLSKMKFVFAKTLADTPHQWASRRQNDEAGYVHLFECWKKFGVWGTWDGPNGPRKYRYLYPGDGFRYWAMTTNVDLSQIINRTRVEGAEEYFAEDMKRAEAAGYIERTETGGYRRTRTKE